MSENKYDEAIQSTVAALLTAKYTLPENWQDQVFTCSCPDCRVPATDKPFAATATRKIGGRDGGQPKPAMWILVGRVPASEEGQAVLCQRHSSEWRSHAARQAAERLELDWNDQDERHKAFEEAGIVCLPLHTVLRAYERELRAQDDPLERVVQEVESHSTVCAISGKEMTYRQAMAVSDKVLKEVINTSQDEEAKKLASALWAKVVKASRDERGYPRFVCREVAEQIRTVIGTVMMKGRDGATEERDATLPARVVIRSIERGKENANLRADERRNAFARLGDLMPDLPTIDVPDLSDHRGGRNDRSGHKPRGNNRGNGRGKGYTHPSRGGYEG